MPRDGDMREKAVRCSFCNKLQSQVDKLIAGPGVFICDECVELCRSIIEEEGETRGSKRNAQPGAFTLPKPMQIKEKLDEYVIGQDEAKIVLSVANIFFFSQAQM